MDWAWKDRNAVPDIAIETEIRSRLRMRPGLRFLVEEWELAGDTIRQVRQKLNGIVDLTEAYK